MLIRYAERLVAEHPDDAESYWYLARAQFDTEQLGEARETIDQTLRFDPSAWSNRRLLPQSARSWVT